MIWGEGEGPSVFGGSPDFFVLSLESALLTAPSSVRLRVRVRAERAGRSRRKRQEDTRLRLCNSNRKKHRKILNENNESLFTKGEGGILDLAATQRMQVAAFFRTNLGIG